MEGFLIVAKAENCLTPNSGVSSLTAPVNTLAWTLKSWWALLLPEVPGRWADRHRAEKPRVIRMEFKAFANAFVMIPCQVIRTGRKLVLRVLGWNPHSMTFFRLVSGLRR